MKTINLTILFDGNVDEIYDALINPRTLTKITGGKATNNQKEGGKFSAWDDYIQGNNIILIPGKKIVQKWTCADFPSGHFTEVTIEFKKKSEKQTELIFTQTNVPDDFYEDIKEGWNHFYFEPIQDYLEDKLWN
jgi:activator of HSP90 ATPase